jgi:hypothetical protein
VWWGGVGGSVLCRYEAFSKFSILLLVATTAICIVSLGVVRTYRTAIAYSYGVNACEFAGSAECFPLYDGVFGGGESCSYSCSL